MTTVAEPKVFAAAVYADEVFAPLDRDHHLERIGGGFETEVYCTDDRRYVVKLKSELGGDLPVALEHTRRMRAVAEAFAECLGPEHSIPSHFVISRDSAGHVQCLVVQPFVCAARQLAKVDYTSLSAAEREHVAEQLTAITSRALAFYRATGYMPDLYGLTSASHDERKRLGAIANFPRLLWSFLVERNLLASCNLVLTESPEARVVLVDYDLARWHPLVRRVYFAVRRAMSWRDLRLVERMKRGG